MVAQRPMQVPGPSAAPTAPPPLAPAPGPQPIPAALSLARQPQSVEATGLEPGFLADLALKIIYFNDHIAAGTVSDAMCLRYGNLVEHALAQLRREHLVEVAGGGNGYSEQGHRYSATEKGVVRIRQLLERTAYAGPAPVTLAQYTAVVLRQAISGADVTPAQVRAAMADLVLEERTIRAIGRAVNTGRSLFLYGPPGNGKTVLAEHTIPLLGGLVLIPHALTADGQVIKVFDPSIHQPVAPPPGLPPLDARFVLCRRPAVVVGGELTLESLDLVLDPATKVYQSPLQVKANGGMFLVDDFGRQQVHPRQLLNRWIVPLEKRVDYLTLHTGRKLEVPFDQLIVFSTNLAPKDLVDEAFLRRIQNKILVDDPSPEAFCEIFRRQCAELGVRYEEAGLAHLLREHYANTGRPFRACHPRDLLRTLVGTARFDGVPPVASPGMLDEACATYFGQL